jgi:hypothetical protein
MAGPPNRSPSPNPFNDPYDPFDAPVEMSNMRRTDALAAGDNIMLPSRETSPPVSPLVSSGPFGSNVQRGFAGTREYQQVPASENPQTMSRSAAASLYSQQSSLSRHITMDPRAQQLAEGRAGEIAEWHIHWTTPAIIIVLFVAGVLGALGHHFFYVHLDGQPAENQLLMVRYGTAFAFFVKSTLVGCVIVCYRQRIWHTFRQKAMTMNAIDGLFSATEDPSQFFRNWEMISNGKLATFMAVCSW